MTSHRLSLTLILIAVAAAGIIVGYALAGFDDGAPIIQTGSSGDTPLLEAIATSVAPAQPTVDVTATYLDSLPVCSDPYVPLGELCLPVQTTVPPCEANIVPDFIGEHLPCIKRDP